MTTLVVHPVTRPLFGSTPIVADAAIGMTALILGALGEGRSVLQSVSTGREMAAMTACLRDLGIVIESTSPGEVAVYGAGLAGLRAPPSPLDFERAPAALARALGILSAQRFEAPIELCKALDAGSQRVLLALRARGATIGTGSIGPLAAGARLGAFELESPTADDDLKAAVLLSGLFASAVTRFREPTVSPDHLERALVARGVPLRTIGPVVELDVGAWDRRLPAGSTHVPGDPTAAAMIAAAAQVVAGSRIVARDVAINPTRTGFFEIVRDMGAGVAIEPKGERGGEPVGNVHAWSEPLRAVSAGGETLARARDDIPAICVLAARAHGTTRLRSCAEFDGGIPGGGRYPAAARVLRAFGVPCREHADGLDITGTEALPATDLNCADDPIVAMSAAILALGARGACRIGQAGGIADRYPKFVATLRALGAQIEVLG
jgi:3-phosphoshikimate 1-carboxyvinyltransferase